MARSLHALSFFCHGAYLGSPYFENLTLYLELEINRISDNSENEENTDRLAGTGTSEISPATRDTLSYYSHYRQIPTGSCHYPNPFRSALK